MNRKNTLRFETERLKDGPITHELVLTAEDMDLLEDPEYRFPNPIEAKVTAQMAGDSVLLTGRIRTVAEAPCARCLEPLKVTLDATLTVVYMADERLKNPARFPELVDDDTHWYDGDSVYPTEQLREALLLQLPPTAACVLERDTFCAVRGVEIPPMVFGTDVPEPEPEQEPSREDQARGKGNSSLAAQFRRLRERQAPKDHRGG